MRWSFYFLKAFFRAQARGLEKAERTKVGDEWNHEEAFFHELGTLQERAFGNVQPPTNRRSRRRWGRLRNTWLLNLTFQIFGRLVLGCIQTDFCKQICKCEYANIINICKYAQALNKLIRSPAEGTACKARPGGRSPRARRPRSPFPAARSGTLWLRTRLNNIE